MVLNPESSLVDVRKIVFVINPISGGRKKDGFERRARNQFAKMNVDLAFAYTEHPGHAHELALEAVRNNVHIVVAVGGDGTINEVASALYGTEVALGIIPEGSGNGLALYLGIPLNERAALRRLSKFETTTIDTGIIEGHPFFNMAGIGFDAKVSDRFAHEKFRGPLGYLRTILAEIGKYQPKHYKLEIDGVSYEREAFMISVANSPQYGNNAYIAPNASITDGVLDICIIHKFPLYSLPIMIFHLFAKTADQSEYLEIIPGKSIVIEREDEGPVHVDGEPKEFSKVLTISVRPVSLHVIS